MSTHTPGPWKVAEFHGYTVIGEGVEVASTHLTGVDDHEALANARLIALAPRMLETLRAISALGYGYCDEGPSLAFEIVREFEEGE